MYKSQKPVIYPAYINVTRGPMVLSVTAHLIPEPIISRKPDYK